MDLKVGNTPIAIMSNFIFCKMENKNPSGSIADRIVDFSINILKNEGKIKISENLIAVANDDLAVSFAVFCAKKGFKCNIVTNSSNSLKNIELCEFFGAKIYYYTKSDKYSNLSEEMRRIIEQYFKKNNIKVTEIDFFNENIIKKCYNNSICEEINHQVLVYGKNLKNIFLFKEDYILAELLKDKFPNSNIYEISIKNNLLNFNSERKNIIKRNELFDDSKIKKGLFKEKIAINIENVSENIKDVAKKSGLIMDYKTSAVYLTAKEVPCFENDVSLIFFYENGERYIEELKKIKK
jgi:cysteine synthase